MKFRIERDVLADAVTWVSRTLPSRVPFPALAGVLVEAGEDGVSFTTTTQDTWSHNTADAVIGEPGTALISGRLLVEIARSLPAQPVSFALQSSGRVEVTCGAASFLLPTLPGDEYPPLPSLPQAVGSVDAGVFAAAVAQVAVASASPDERNHAYAGIRMEIEPDGRLTLAATDRYRLAVRELPWEPVAADQPIAVTIPGREFLDATKAFADAGTVTVHLGEAETSLSLAAGTRQTGLRLGVLAIASLVGLSRAVVGVHWPSTPTERKCTLGRRLVLGEVIGVHLAPDLIRDGIYDTAGARHVLRGGGPADYFTIGPAQRFRMTRPD